MTLRKIHANRHNATQAYFLGKITLKQYSNRLQYLDNVNRKQIRVKHSKAKPVKFRAYRLWSNPSMRMLMPVK